MLITSCERGALVAALSILALCGCTTTHVTTPDSWRERPPSLPLPAVTLAVEGMPNECKSHFRDHSAAERLGGALVAAKVKLDQNEPSNALEFIGKARMTAELEAWHTDEVMKLDGGETFPDHALLEPVFCLEDVGNLFVRSLKRSLRPILHQGENPDYIVRVKVVRDDVALSWTGGKAFSVASLPIVIGVFFLGLWANHFEHTVEVRVEMLKGTELTPVLRRSYLITVEGAISDFGDKNVREDVGNLINYVLWTFVTKVSQDVSTTLMKSQSP